MGRGLPGTTSAATWFSLSIGIAGVFIAFFAPVTGQRADEGGHRKRSVTLWTLFVIVAMTALFLVKNEPAYFWLGCALLGVASIGSSFADVSYHAMLRQVSTPSTIGRVSGFGWSMGYLGGIVLLLVCYYGFVAAPSGGTAGLLHIATDGGLNFRLVAVFAAAWYLVFATPLMVSVPEMPSPAQPHRVGLLASYRLLIADLRTLWHTDRNAVYFLLSSALFRDGLAGGLSDRQFGLAVAHVEPHSLRAGPVEGLTHRRLPAGGEVECLEVRGEDPAATPDVGSPERQVIGHKPAHRGTDDHIVDRFGGPAHVFDDPGLDLLDEETLVCRAENALILNRIQREGRQMGELRVAIGAAVLRGNRDDRRDDAAGGQVVKGRVSTPGMRDQEGSVDRLRSLAEHVLAIVEPRHRIAPPRVAPLWQMDVSSPESAGELAGRQIDGVRPLRIGHRPAK